MSPFYFFVCLFRFCFVLTKYEISDKNINKNKKNDCSAKCVKIKWQAGGRCSEMCNLLTGRWNHWGCLSLTASSPFNVFRRRQKDTEAWVRLGEESVRKFLELSFKGLCCKLVPWGISGGGDQGLYVGHSLSTFCCIHIVYQVQEERKSEASEKSTTVHS